MPPTTPKTVLETILTWSQASPIWQRDALRRIVAQGRLEPGDLKDLVELCKQGRGAKDIALKAIPLAEVHFPANPGEGAAVSLTAIAEVQGVNNLAPSQTLTFQPKGLTIIYGDNGAGKSGYARILKRACGARHVGKIEPNIYAQQLPSHASATLAYSVGGVHQAPETWHDTGNPHAVLSAVRVFDSDCAVIHIKGENEVAFRPFGSDVPDELATACQAVKGELTAEQKQFEKARNPIFAKPSWKETTAVGRTLAALKHDTDLQKIQDLATFAATETTRLERLREDLSKNPAKAASEQVLKADNVKRVFALLTLAELKTSDSKLFSVAAFALDAKLKSDAALLAATKAFSGEPLKGVGGEVWRSLWDSARRYSTEIAYRGQLFPHSHDDVRCVLCQQPLDEAAHNRMARFEEFIQKDSERQAQDAQRVSEQVRQELDSLTLATRNAKANLQELALQNADLARNVRRCLASARLRRYALRKALGSAKEPRLPDAAPSQLANLTEFENTLRAYATELQKSATAEERKKLEAEFAELNDRALLAGMLQTVRDELERLKTIYFLEQCLGDTSTNAITKLGNNIADTVITPKLRDRFQEEIVKLAADTIRVEIVRSGGRYGSPQYQVRLFAKSDAKVQDILSEGEKTCVALAGFLSELATAVHRSALVFDDPISSLDHRWRKKVAERLVQESKHRQVIVFTHDLIFVNDLDDLAESEPVKPQLVTVSRGPAGAGTVIEGVPWKGGRIEDRIDKLEKAARSAKQLNDDNKDDEYNNEAANIYNLLRASWERTLEDIVFFRVVQRHRDYIDTKHLKKVTVLTEADCDLFQSALKKCCDVVSAHDPSIGRNATAPPPSDVEKDIRQLKDWVSTLRDRQKRIK